MINKNHSDYPKFMGEYNALIEACKAEKAALPKFTGLDGPSGDIDRKCVQELKKLKKKYAHLYDGEIEQ